MANPNLVTWPVPTLLHGQSEPSYVASPNSVTRPVPTLLIGQSQPCYMTSSNPITWPIPTLLYQCWKAVSSSWMFTAHHPHGVPSGWITHSWLAHHVAMIHKEHNIMLQWFMIDMSLCCKNSWGTQPWRGVVIHEGQNICCKIFPNDSWRTNHHVMMIHEGHIIMLQLFMHTVL